jgi:hypothetical protein
MHASLFMSTMHAILHSVHVEQSLCPPDASIQPMKTLFVRVSITLFFLLLPAVNSREVRKRAFMRLCEGLTFRVYSFNMTTAVYSPCAANHPPTFEEPRRNSMNKAIAAIPPIADSPSKRSTYLNPAVSYSRCASCINSSVSRRTRS